MTTALRWIEGLSPAAFWGGGVALTVAPAFLGAVIGEPFLWGGVVLSGLVAPTVGAGAWLRLRASRLPLVVSERAVRGRLDGCTAFWIRASLGRGRILRDATAQARWVGESGDVTELELVMPRIDVLVGPWTVAIVDRSGISEAGGRLEVELAGAEGRTSWAAEGRYAAASIQVGRFVAPVERRRGRIAVRSDWKDVTSA